MITIYIKKIEKEDKILSKIPEKFQKVIINFIGKINKFFIKQIDKNTKVYLLPDIHRTKVYKKIISKIQKEKQKNVKIRIILENDIKQYKNEFKYLNILDGKQIIKENIDILLKYILEDIPMELQDIYILTNIYKESNIKILKEIVPKVKSLNIITNEIKKYSVLEEIMRNEGIINVANNKKKSLRRAKIIINLDFSKEDLSNYNIFRNSIIINLTDEKINNLKAFEGIIIQDIELKLEEKQENFIKNNNLYKSFKKIEIYESIYNKEKEDKEIINLYGNNGIISKKELRNEQKILTNIKN